MISQLNDLRKDEMEGIPENSSELPTLENLAIKSSSETTSALNRQLLDVSESSGAESADENEVTLTEERETTPPPHVASGMKTPLGSPEAERPISKLPRARHDSDVSNSGKNPNLQQTVTEQTTKQS